MVMLNINSRIYASESGKSRGIAKKVQDSADLSKAY